MRWREAVSGGKQLLNGVVHLPLILPPVVTGYILLLSFGRKGPVGAFLDETFGLVFSFRWTGAALAAAVMAFPLMVRAIRLAIEAVDPKLEQAAGTLGASRLGVRDGDVAADPAGGAGGGDPRVRQVDGRVRSDDHLRVQHSGQTQTLPSAIYAFPGAGRGRGRRSGWCSSRSQSRWGRFFCRRWRGGPWRERRLDVE